MKKLLSIGCGIVLISVICTVFIPGSPDTARAGVGVPVDKIKPALPGPDSYDRELPAKGKFLVASQGLLDPRFRETVVLLIDYSASGATGLIINRPTKVALAQALPSIPGLKKRSDAVYYGGPVENNIILMLIRSGEDPEESVRVFGDVYVSASRNTLERMISSHKTEKQLRTYSGYAGWMARQLDWEVSRGDWLIIPADSRSIFESDSSEIWLELIRRGSAIQVWNQSNNGTLGFNHQDKPMVIF